MDWLATLHFEGIVIGICTFLIIGLFHPIVVIPGEDEMGALAMNALGALRGELPLQEYNPH